jgi:hypothetical protein
LGNIVHGYAFKTKRKEHFRAWGEYVFHNK